MEQTLRFGGHRFDLDSGRLWLGDDEIRLTPKASGVLKVLVGQAGHPVTKDELFARVWSGVAVSDDALTSCIQELRKALGDDAKQPRFIETRHRRGYRFIAELARAEAAAVYPSSPPQSSPSHEISSIAVLPFADMSPARDQDYLCEGLAEELINALTHIDGLRVASRTASFQFRDHGANIHEVGEHLGVETLLEGSVRKSDTRLRVTVQLIEVNSGYHRWSRRFDRELHDMFAIQDEIAESVVTSLRGSLLSQREKKLLSRPQTGTAAYEYYLRGRQHLPPMTRPDLEKSAEMFAMAIEHDPNYGPAFAGLAMVHATLYEWFGAGEEGLAKAEAASARALELCPNLAESHVARGCALALSRQYDAAGWEFREAIRLNPHLFEAYYYYGRTSFAAGDVAKSADLFRDAADARHEDYQSLLLMEQSLRILGKREESEKVAREGLERAERALVLNPRDARALSLGSGTLYHLGEVGRAVEWCKRSLEIAPDDISANINAACLQANMGNKEETLALLERVFSGGRGKRDWIEHDRDYDLVRDDPRFQRLLAKLS